MALLTAEDVLNKAFSKTKYREGFDQDEVDDYLDEVAHAIQTLTAERNELQSRLDTALADLRAARDGAPLPAPSALVPTSSSGAPATQSTATMLAMAQKLHDEYVTSGQEERQRIIEEAEEKARAVLAQAERDGRDKAQAATAQAERDRADLERKIDDLRRFERDYRARLKTYLENLMGDLDHASTTGETPSADYRV